MAQGLNCFPLFGVLVAALLPAVAHSVELKNDAWTSGEQASFQSGLVAGEIVASRLVPAQECPCEVTSISFLYGGEQATRTVTVKIWDDSAETLAPGTEIFSASYQLVSSNDTLQTIDLSSAPVTVDGAFRVGIAFQNDGLPSAATDEDGTTNETRNFLFSGDTWFLSSNLQLTGDWIIRATIADEEGPACGQPVTTGDEPKTTDCLFILRTAVGQTTCSPVCVCNTNGQAGITSSDALLCLRRAVGQDVTLSCNCG